MAQRTQEALPVPRLHLCQVQPDCRETAHYGSPGMSQLITELFLSMCPSKVALKRQQAAEDAIAIGLRAVATGAPMNTYLPPGPIFGIQVTEPEKHLLELNNKTTPNSESEDFDPNDSESVVEDSVGVDHNLKAISVDSTQTTGKV